MQVNRFFAESSIEGLDNAGVDMLADFVWRWFDLSAYQPEVRVDMTSEGRIGER